MRRTLTMLTVALLLTGGASVARAAEPGPITWHACQGDDAAELDRAGAQCGELTVPLNHADPGGRTITVAVSRIPAADRAHRLGSLLVNTGGPGAPGVGDVLPLSEWLRDAGRRYDLIGMDPRFVGRSTPIDCGWPVGSWIRGGGPARADFHRTAALEAELARRCGTRHRDVLPYVTTRQTARDMDAIRAALGEPRLSYLGYSYGTYLGTVYAELFPDRVGRLVLDSVVDPATYGPRLLRDAGAANEAGLRDWAVRSGRLGMLATVDRVLAAATRHPLRVGDFRVDAHTIRFLLLDGLGDDRPEPTAELTETVEVLDRAVRNGSAEPTPSLAEALTFVLTGAESFYGSAQAAIICGDVAAPRNPAVYLRDIRAAAAREPHFAPTTRNLGPCAFWPVTPREQPTRIGTSIPALLVQSTGDTRTTYQGALKMRAVLPSARMVTLTGARIHAVFGNYANPCIDSQVINYLKSGVLPAADLTC